MDHRSRIRVFSYETVTNLNFTSFKNQRKSLTLILWSRYSRLLSVSCHVSQQNSTNVNYTEPQFSSKISKSSVIVQPVMWTSVWCGHCSTGADWPANPKYMVKYELLNFVKDRWTYCSRLFCTVSLQVVRMSAVRRLCRPDYYYYYTGLTRCMLVLIKLHYWYHELL